MPLSQQEPESVPESAEDADIKHEHSMRLHLPSTGIGSKVQPAGSTIATPFNESQPIQSPQSPPSENRTDHAHMLAEKLLNHQKGSIARAPPSLSSRPSTCNSDLTSPSLGNASNRATPGGMTPRSELGSDPEGSFKTPDVPASAVSASKPRELSSTVRQPPYVNPITVGDSPNASRPGSGATTPDRVREQDKVTHIPAEPRSPPANPGSPRPPLGKAHSFGKEAHKQSLKPNGSTGSVHPAEATAKSLSDIRAPSPNKINGRPAVFSAIPPKAEKDASQKDRSHPAVSKERPSMPASGEKKTSVLGKMFGAMKSSEHLHPDQSKDHHHHHHHKDKGKRGRSKHPHREGDSEYESESGAESDVSAASAVSSSAKSDRGGGFFGMKRRGSGGKKQDHFRGTEQDKAAALAAGRGKDGQSSHPADSIAVPAPPLSRRSSEKKHGDKHSESGSAVGNIGQSLKDMVTGPLMQRKPSMQSNRSFDGKSEHGDDHDESASRTGGAPSTSLLKKYGACEKVAIGRGATAVVRLAHKWDKSTEKLYAVKEFRKRRKNESEKDYVKKLTSEFCISSTLHHANIVETVDLVQDENHHWCEVMEYCPNGDLYAAIKKGDLSQSQINTYFQQMVSGVAYLHSMGVAHRDIKPENLLLDAQNVIKITDFGVSDVFRMCWEKTCHLSRGLCGSEPYIAPEQFEPKAQYDARMVDVWACAIVFYCMQFQELPWRIAKLTDSSFSAFAEAYHQTNSPPPLSDIHPRECRALIKHMLAPIPKERITAEQIVSSNKWFQGLLPQEVQPAGSATPVSTAKEQKTKEATISAAPTKAAANPPVQER